MQNTNWEIEQCPSGTVRENETTHLSEQINKLEQQLLAAQAAIAEHNNAVAFPECRRDIKVDLTMLKKRDENRDANLLCDVVRLLSGVFIGNKSLLGGSQPPLWSPRMIALIAIRNLENHDEEVRKPLVDALKGYKYVNESGYCKKHHWLVEHDEEVRKPLIDALIECAHLLAREHESHHGNCGGIDCPVFKASRKGFNALAKV